MPPEIRIHGTDGVFRQNDNEPTLLRAALRAGIGFPYECHAGGCGTCKFELLDGTLDVLWEAAPALTDRDRRHRRHLACQTRARSDCTIKVRPAPEYQARVAPVAFTATLDSIVDITHDLREFRFRSDAPAAFIAGQYALVHFPALGCTRSFSMSNTPNAHGEWQFQIRRTPNGRATSYLFDRLRMGDRVDIDAPYGLAYLRTDVPRDLVCVAGGSGLAPMISIARATTQQDMLATRRLHFFYGARTSRDVCGEDHLRALPGYGERIRYYPAVSEPAAQEWTGEAGYIHEVVERTLGSRINEFEFYFAGPPPMALAMQEMLVLKHKLPHSQLHYDRFF